MKIEDTYRAKLRVRLTEIVADWPPGVFFSTSQVMEQLAVQTRGAREKKRLRERVLLCLKELAELKRVKIHPRKTVLKTIYYQYEKHETQ